MHAKVLRHGWALEAIGGEDRRADWVYTVGLSSGFAHPELVVVGGLLDDAACTLNELGELVRGGRRFEAGDLADGLAGAGHLRRGASRAPVRRTGRDL